MDFKPDNWYENMVGKHEKANKGSQMPTLVLPSIGHVDMNIHDTTLKVNSAELYCKETLICKFTIFIILEDLFSVNKI